jgi:molybdate transport system substrate-binding protein
MSRVLAVCCLLAVAGCQAPRRDAVRLFVAASTRDVCEAVGRDFTQETGVAVELNAAASSTLATQIDNGADADLFLSADEKWADYLEKRGHVAERRDLLGNRLVVVTPADRPAALGDLSDLKGEHFQHLALGRADVPAGAYAREALKNAGVWEAVEKRVVEGGDVRAVLTYVERGEVDAGFVYVTDARTSSRVRVVCEVPEKLHTLIRYPLVRLKRDGEKPAAARFYEYLSGDAARKRFEDAGFIVLP